MCETDKTISNWSQFARMITQNLSLIQTIYVVQSKDFVLTDGHDVNFMNITDSE